MKRVLWLGVGLAVGALVFRALSKKAQAFTPGGLAASARNSAGGLVDSVRSFVDDVRDGMAEREEQIHAAFADGVVLEEFGDLEQEEGSDRR
ncbi:MAG: hypothetical protein E6F99_12490 [Actinobacteria bacterium]|nr:MAG: hypothetical protein E6F99_12490 [Actinomycetota bacterium]